MIFTVCSQENDENQFSGNQDGSKNISDIGNVINNGFRSFEKTLFFCFNQNFKKKRSGLPNAFSFP